MSVIITNKNIANENKHFGLWHGIPHRQFTFHHAYI